MESPELFALLGFPARLLGRLSLLLRYIWSSHFSTTRQYAFQRFGSSYRFRPWLLLDMEGLESMEQMIDHGSDEELLSFRAAHVTTGSSTAVVVSHPSFLRLCCNERQPYSCLSAGLPPRLRRRNNANSRLPLQRSPRRHSNVHDQPYAIHALSLFHAHPTARALDSNKFSSVTD